MGFVQENRGRGGAILKGGPKPPVKTDPRSETPLFVSGGTEPPRTKPP